VTFSPVQPKVIDEKKKKKKKAPIAKEKKR